jgi:N4-gp56 family major capsid protein
MKCNLFTTILGCISGLIKRKKYTGRELTFYEIDLLERISPFLSQTKFLQTKPFPENKGTRIKFRRYGSFTADAEPLAKNVLTGEKV